MAKRKTARQIAAAKRNLAKARAARNRRRGKRIDRKISKVRSKTKRRVLKYANIAEANAYTHSTQGGLYLNARGVKAFKKGVKVNTRGQKKVSKLKKKKKRRRR